MSCCLLVTCVLAQLLVLIEQVVVWFVLVLALVLLVFFPLCWLWPLLLEARVALLLVGLDCRILLLVLRWLFAVLPVVVFGCFPTLAIRLPLVLVLVLVPMPWSSGRSFVLVVSLVLESAACLALLVLCLPLFGSPFALVVEVRCWLLVLVAAR